jgi:hypothetical protein
MAGRILREATSPASSRWRPGQAELQEALLLVQLLSRVVPAASEWLESCLHCAACCSIWLVRLCCTHWSIMVTLLRSCLHTACAHCDGREQRNTCSDTICYKTLFYP